MSGRRQAWGHGDKIMLHVLQQDGVWVLLPEDFTSASIICPKKGERWAFWKPGEDCDLPYSLFSSAQAALWGPCSSAAVGAGRGMWGTVGDRDDVPSPQRLQERSSKPPLPRLSPTPPATPPAAEVGKRRAVSNSEGILPPSWAGAAGLDLNVDPVETLPVWLGYSPTLHPHLCKPPSALCTAVQ